MQLMEVSMEWVKKQVEKIFEADSLNELYNIIEENICIYEEHIATDDKQIRKDVALVKELYQGASVREDKPGEPCRYGLSFTGVFEPYFQTVYRGYSQSLHYLPAYR